MPVLWMGPGFTVISQDPWVLGLVISPKGWCFTSTPGPFKKGSLEDPMWVLRGPSPGPIWFLCQTSGSQLCTQCQTAAIFVVAVKHGDCSVSQRFGVRFAQLWKRNNHPTQCALVGIATIGPMKETWRNDDKKPWYPWSTLNIWCSKLGPPFSYVVVSAQSEGYVPQMGCSSSTGVNNGEHFHLEVFEITIGFLRYH